MATVIKASTEVRQKSAPDVHAVAFDLADMSSKADAYLQSIHHEAAQIIREAHEQSDRVRQAAEEAGRKAALEKFDREVEKRVAERVGTVLPALQQAVGQILDQRAHWHRHCERTLVHLATAIAERLLRRRLEKEPEISVAWVRECLEISAGAVQATIRLHPDDFAGIQGQIERLSAEIGRVAAPQITADESIQRGGCVVQMGFGTIDMQLNAQLARIEEELLGE